MMEYMYVFMVHLRVGMYSTLALALALANPYSLVDDGAG